MDQPVDKPNNEAEQDPSWYNDFLTNYDFQNPKPGQLIEGTILNIEEDGILVDIGVKRDALVPQRDLNQVPEDTLASINVGDKVHVYVLNRPSGDRDLLVSLYKGMEHETWENAERYLQNSTAMELTIVGHNRGGLIVEFETLRGFLPFSQVPGLRGIRNPRLAEQIKKDMVGTELEMKVIEVVRERNRLIFSATAAEEEKRKSRLAGLNRGDIISGEVVNIVDFGVFIDLDGIDGLVHLSEMDWKKVKHPSELFEIGDNIDVKVLEVDIERQRVSLSRKAVIPSPWENLDELPKVGDCLEGRVVKVVNFGAFIELPIGIEGLVHTSQIGYTHTENPKEALKRGEVVLIRILNVDPDRRRISLSMRQVPREMQISWAMEHLDEALFVGEADSTLDSESEDVLDTPDSTPSEDTETPGLQANELEGSDDIDDDINTEGLTEPTSLETDEEPVGSTEAESELVDQSTSDGVELDGSDSKSDEHLNAPSPDDDALNQTQVVILSEDEVNPDIPEPSPLSDIGTENSGNDDSGIQAIDSEKENEA